MSDQKGDRMDVESKEKGAAEKSDKDKDKENKDKDKKDDDESEGSSESTTRSGAEPKSVVVHPLVLLSVVDHYTRVAKDTNKRVVGVLLGENYKGKVDITNSYAVPFEEDTKDEKIWFLDSQYHQEMFAMFKKVNGMHAPRSARFRHCAHGLRSSLCTCSEGESCWLVQHGSEDSSCRPGDQRAVPQLHGASAAGDHRRQQHKECEQ
jgi:hypothetical protein